jgi:hypothetical protein
MSVPNLLVEVHRTDGQIDRFEVFDSEQAKVLVDLLNPAKVFANPSLMLSEANCLTTYRSQSIVRIDVGGADAPIWPHLGGASSIREVSEDEFKSVSGSEELARERMEAWRNPGTKQEGFTEVVLTTGKRIVWRVTMVSSEMVALDSISVARSLLNATALHGQRADGATTIINMAHAARLSFYPGPPTTHARVPSVKRVS